MFRRRAVSTYLSALAILGLIALAGGIVRAGPIEQKISAEDAASGDGFGVVDVDGDTVVAGAPYDDDNGTDSGSVYVFVRCRGVLTQRQKLTPSDGAASDLFGWALALDGDTLAIYGGNAVYVFTRGTAGEWTQQQKLTGSDTEAGDNFGYSLDLLEDTLVVGSRNDDLGSNTDCGSAYVFTRDSSGKWSQHTKLSAPDRAPYDLFGRSISIYHNTVAIGAPGNDPTQTSEKYSTGAVYTFTRDANGYWSQEQKIYDPTGDDGDQFGYAVSLGSNRLLVGAGGASSSNGAAYFFTRSSGKWTAEKLISPPDPKGSDYFGSAVALVGDIAVIGAYYWESDDRGAAWVYELGSGGWTMREKLICELHLGAACWHGYSVAVDGNTVVIGAVKDDDGSGLNPAGAASAYTLGQKLTAKDAASGDGFSDVAVDGNTVVVGALYDDDNGASSGSVYAFLRAEDGSRTQTQKLTASDGSAGDVFGYRVALDGDTLAVTSINAVYVFTRDAAGVWTQKQKLTASDGGPIGSSLDLDEDTLVTGAQLDDGGGKTDCGSAYVFVRDSNGNWKQQAKLTASDGVAGDQLGRSVSIDGDTVAIGAPFHDPTETNDKYATGAVYVFTRDKDGAWSQEQKIYDGIDGQDEAEFGTAVAVSGDLLLIGAPREWLHVSISSGLYETGCAYVYARSSGKWTCEETLALWPRDGGDLFGSSVALVGEVAVIGAPHWESDDRGVAWVFDRDSGHWPRRTKLISGDIAGTDFFGTSVAFDGATAAIGALGDDFGGLTAAGSAYVYEHVGPGPDFEVQSFTFPTSTSGLTFQGQLEAVGGASPFSWDVSSGTLPVSGGIDPETGEIDGTWDTPGTYDFTLRVRGICGHEATSDFSVTVNAWPEITTTSLPEGTTGRPYQLDLAGTGGTTPNTWTVTSGNLPVSGTLDPVTGSLSGAALSPGDYAFTVRLTDSLGAYIEESYTVTINELPSITTATLRDWTTQQPYDLLVEGTDGTLPYVWTVSSGDLPISGTLDSASGKLSGDALDPGDYTFTVRLTDAAGAYTEADYTVTINELPSITTATLRDWTTLQPYDLLVEGADGTLPYVWTVSSGDLPISGTLDPDAGSLSGDALDPGDYTFTVRLTDAAGAEIEKAYNVTINELPSITTDSFPDWTTGRPYSLLVDGTNGTAPYAWTVTSGDLPIAGTLDPDTGSLSGDALAPGDYSFTVRLTDVAGAAIEKAYEVTINDLPSITSPPDSVSICNRPFDCCLTVAEGTAPFTWSVADGTLPWGLTLDASTGDLCGTPTNAGYSEFSIRVTDMCGATDEQDFTIDTTPLADLAQKKDVEDITGSTFDEPAPFVKALELVAGTKLNVSAKLRGKGTLPLTLSLLDADGKPVSLGAALVTKSKSVSLKNYIVPATGRYYLQLAKTSTISASVRLTIKAKAPKKASGADSVVPAGSFEVDCGTLTGALVTITVKAAKGSTVLPTVLSVKNEAGEELLVPGELKLKKKSAVLKMRIPVAGGNLTIRVGARDGTSGQITWTAKIKEPKGYNYTRPGDAAGFER